MPFPPPKASLADRIDQGRGVVPADLVLKGGRVLDLITGDLVETDVAICGDTIVGTYDRYDGVVEIDGKAVADPARVTVDFAPEGRLAGIAACNRYFGSYALSGEGLRLSPLGATKMACEPGAMEEERRFIEAAGRIDGFAIAADASLQLRAGGRVVMRGRRP